MLAPCCVLLVLDVLVPPDWISALAPGAVGAFTRHAMTGPLHMGAATGAWLSVGGAVALAAYALFRHDLPTFVVRPLQRTQSAPAGLLEALHSGLIGDYVAWLAVGLALIAGALAMA